MFLAPALTSTLQPVRRKGTEEGMRPHLRACPGSCTYHLCLHSVGQNLTPWPYPSTRAFERVVTVWSQARLRAHLLQKVRVDTRGEWANSASPGIILSNLRVLTSQIFLYPSLHPCLWLFTCQLYFALLAFPLPWPQIQPPTPLSWNATVASSPLWSLHPLYGHTFPPI